MFRQLVDHVEPDARGDVRAAHDVGRFAWRLDVSELLRAVAASVEATTRDQIDTDALVAGVGCLGVSGVMALPSLLAEPRR